MDSLTVLRCVDPGARGGKHIGADGTSAKIETKTNFTFRTIPVRDFDSFVGALALILPDRSVVLAAVGGEGRLAPLGDVLGGLLHPLHDLLRHGVVLLGTHGTDAGKGEADGQSTRRGPTGRHGCF